MYGGVGGEEPRGFPLSRLAGLEKSRRDSEWHKDPAFDVIGLRRKYRIGCGRK